MALDLGFKQRLVLPLIKGTTDFASFKVSSPYDESYPGPGPGFFLSPDADASAEEQEKALNSKDLISIVGKKINTPFLVGLFSFCYLDHDRMDGCHFCFKAQRLREYLGLSSGGNGFDVIKALKELEHVRVVSSKVMVIENLTFSNGLIHFYSLYLFELIMCVSGYEVAGSRYTSAVDSRMVGHGRYTAAKEVVLVLASLAARRGTFNGGCAQISLNRLLQSCPTFGNTFRELHNSSANRLLKNTLTKAVELFDKFCWFPDKKVSVVLPDKINRFELRHCVTVIVKEDI